HHPNPYIDWHDSPIQIPVALLDWPADKRIAGISSFGISGTNAHVVVEGMPTAASPENKLDRPYHLLTLSAKTAEALQAYAHRYRDFLSRQPDLALGDLCYTS